MKVKLLWVALISLTTVIATILSISNIKEHGSENIDKTNAPVELGKKEVLINFMLQSFYFGDLKQPTDNTIKLTGTFEEDAPTLIQITPNSAQLKYSSGLSLLFFFPTEGYPITYKNLEHSEITLNLTLAKIYKFRVDLTEIIYWRDSLNLSEYESAYVYSNNIDFNCALEGEFCSNNQIHLGSNKNIYLICTAKEDKLLTNCDKEVNKLNFIE